MKMKQFKRILCAVLAVLLLSATVLPAFADERMEIHISTPEDMLQLANNCKLDTWSKKVTVVLENDIDLSEVPFVAIPTFCGYFKGEGHTISGFTSGTDGSHVGLFRYVQVGAVIMNLNVRGTVTPDGRGYYVGGLVGTNYGTIKNCNFDGKISASVAVGGLVGENYGLVSGCIAYGTINGKHFSGGIVGYNDGIVQNCANYVSVNTTIESNTLTLDELTKEDLLTESGILSATQSNNVTDSGGIVGVNLGEVTNSTNYGEIGYPHYGLNVGGVAGRQSGYIASCENRGLVYGRQDIGGIVGQMEPYTLLEHKESLSEEISKLQEASNTALENLDKNAGETSQALEDVKSGAESFATISETVSEAILVASSETNSKAVWDKVASVADISADVATETYNALDTDTREKLLNGEITWIEAIALAQEAKKNAASRGVSVAASATDTELDEDTISRIAAGKGTEEDYRKLAEIGNNTLGSGTGLFGDLIESRRESKKAQSNQETASRTSAITGAIKSADSLQVFNERFSAMIDSLTEDLRVVNEHYSNVLNMIANALSGDFKVVVRNDISEEDSSQNHEGKVYDCINYGKVNGDSNVGGIAGSMDVELDLDLESILTSEALDNTEIATRTYWAKCIIRTCINYATVIGRKSYIGGVVGESDIGMVVAAENYGSIEGATYVGGVAGRSNSLIFGGYAMCSVEGTEYVGGIAGWGTRVMESYAIVSVPNEENVSCCGGIAGWMDLKEEDTTICENNYFISDTLGGVDGISYGEKAEPVTYEQMITSDALLPEEFRSMSLTFVADGEVIKKVYFHYGEGIDESEIPEVPNLEGYSGYWPDYDFENLTFSDTLEAVYVLRSAVLAAGETREGSPKSIVIAEGSFEKGAGIALDVHEGDITQLSDFKIIEQWDVEVDGNLASDGYSMRYLVPEEYSPDEVKIWVQVGNDWQRVSTKKNGSYLIFHCESTTVTFCAVEAETEANFLETFLIVVDVLAVVLVAYFVLRRFGVVPDLIGIAGKKFKKLFQKMNAEDEETGETVDDELPAASAEEPKQDE